MNIPVGIGHIGEEEYQNELKALVGGVKVNCESCGAQYFLGGGMKALLADFDQAFTCSDCATKGQKV